MLSWNKRTYANISIKLCLQWKKETRENNSESGDGLVFVDRQAKLKLVLIEKLFDEIKVYAYI